MALEFGFYDSYEHDRLYTAENMNDIFEGVLTDGVYAGVGDHFVVKPAIGLQVTVGTGRAWFKMTWNKNRTVAPLNLDASDPVYDRIDTVCIRVRKNINIRINDFYIYKGTVSPTPQPPALIEVDDTYYLPLANVTVRANSGDISAGDIELLVGKERCPFVTSILQQTDISDLFKQWEVQFTTWWNNLESMLAGLDEGDIRSIVMELQNKVDKADKATANDISLNSDSKWMTPAMTKQMITDAVGDGLGDIEETLKNGVVTSFNGRKGVVVPGDKDYTASMVGALPITGGTVSGNLQVNGTLGVVGETTFNSNINGKGNLYLKNDTNYGNGIYLGNTDYVHITEPTDNALEVKANSINFVLSGSGGSANTNFKINGTNPFSTSNSSIFRVYLIGASEVTSSVSGESNGNPIAIPSYVSLLVIHVKNGGMFIFPWLAVRNSVPSAIGEYILGTRYMDSGATIRYILYVASTSECRGKVYATRAGSMVQSPGETFDIYGIYIE